MTFFTEASLWLKALMFLGLVLTICGIVVLPLLRGRITGWKFLYLFVAFFGIIIAVNLYMARSALRTFPGLETANSYVASQQFDVRRAEQEALGWDVAVRIEGGMLRVSITDDAGQPVGVQQISGVFGRATTVRDDQTPEFQFDGLEYVAPIDAGEGYWNLRLEAIAPDGTLFTQRIEVVATGG